MNTRVTGVLVTFLIVLLGAAVWTVTSSQAQTSGTLPTPTYWTSFAQAEIAKPTYTPLPPPTATQPPPQLSLPAEIPTNTPASVAQAVIVDVPLGVSSSTNAQAPVNYAGGKLILVDISEQHMYVYEGETLVYSFVASTGMNNATRTGSFSVLEKIPNAYGATWNIWMPNWLGIYWAGSMQNGIHALPILPNGATLWAGFLGTPISYGCVVLDTFDAQVLYDWAEVGVPVEIQW
jgi:lipoprotein-anchoring transpeptidase ErfK/SrfK